MSEGPKKSTVTAQVSSTSAPNTSGYDQYRQKMNDVFTNDFWPNNLGEKSPPLVPILKTQRSRITANILHSQFSASTFVPDPAVAAPKDDMTDNISSQAYIDRSMDAVRAQNDARFAEVLTEIKGVGVRLDHIEKGQISPWQVWGAALTSFLAVLAVLAFGGDQFGLGAGLAEQRQGQIVRDQAQDEKLTEIITRLDALLAAQATQAAPAPESPSE